MNAKMLITGVAVAVLAAGGAAAQTDPASGSQSSGSMGATAPTSQDGATTGDMGANGAATHHAMQRPHKSAGEHARRGEGGAYAAPQQPIPYAQLDQYMKASPRQRMAMDRSSANTGSTADTAATSPSDGSMGSSPAATRPDTAAMQSPQGDQSASGQAATPDGSMGSMATPKTGGTGAMDTNPPVNGATAGAADQNPDKGMGQTGSDATGTPAAGTPNQSSGPTPH